jgi:hypothetical protein
VTLLVDEPIDLAEFSAVAAGWDDRVHVPRLDGPDERVAVVALVADERLGPCRRQPQQRLPLANIVMDLTTGQHEVEGVAQAVGDGVDLGAEPAPRAAQRLGLGAALRRPGRAGMGADDGGVDQDALQIRQMRAALMQRLPDAMAAPAGEALENRVPLAMLGRQQAPLRPRPQNPQDRHQKGPASWLPTHADMLVGQ